MLFGTQDDFQDRGMGRDLTGDTNWPAAVLDRSHAQTASFVEVQTRAPFGPSEVVLVFVGYWTPGWTGASMPGSAMVVEGCWTPWGIGANVVGSAMLVEGSWNPSGIVVTMLEPMTARPLPGGWCKYARICNGCRRLLDSQ